MDLNLFWTRLGQDHYKQAVRDLAEVFGDAHLANSLAVHLAETAPREVYNIVRQKYEMPEPCRRTWPAVRAYLTLKMKLPAAFVDELHEKGLIFSDPRGNCVFARDQESGVFKVGTGDRLFNQTSGKDGGPFVLPGPDNKVIVTDSPLEALSLKLMKPDSTVIATNGFMLADKLRPYLSQKEIFLAPSRDRTGLRMAGYLAGHFPKAERIQPEQGCSWNEYRIPQFKEQENRPARLPAMTHDEAPTATPAISQSTSMGR